MERVQNLGTSGFNSPVFLVQKKTGKLRPVIDLSSLNQFINKQPFKMETVKSVRQSIMVNDWAVPIDLTDAYLHVPIHLISRKYLRFIYEHQVFQFMALLFRMSLSLWIFTKLIEVIAVHVHQCAISLFPYLDNWLIRDLIRSRLISHTKYCLQTVQNLGFIPNLKKSGLIPAQKFTIIGMEFLTQQNIVRIPADRVEPLILSIKTFLSQIQVSARTFFSLLGKLSAAADFILLGRLHLRPLQLCLLSVWKPHILPLDHQVTVNGMIKFHFRWWMDTNRFVQGIPIHPPDPNVFLYMDASHFRWGAHLEPMSLSFHGRWSGDQSQLDINMLEIMAIHFALIRALKYIHHSCAMISTDNATVVSYINKQGGTHSPNLCPTMVPKTTYCHQDPSYPKQIHCFGRSIIENGQNYQNRMGIGSVDREFSFPNVQLSQCGSVCNTFQSQTSTLCIPSS